jgi:hypothetical protein
MNRQHVISSNIHSIGYESDVLEIAFHSGGVYQYLNVPELVYVSLMSADSKGSYFHSYIKGKYSYKKISEEQ